MEKLQLRQFQGIQRALSVLKERKSDGAVLLAARRRLEAIEARASRASVEQGAAADYGSIDGIEIRELRLMLRQDHLIPISRFGRVALRWVPGAEKALRVPHARANSADLVAAGKRMAKAVAPKKCAKLFVDAEFPANFVAQLRAATEKLDTRSREDDAMRKKRTRATVELKNALREGRHEIALIGALLGPALRKEKGLARVWKHVSRIPPKFGRPTKESAKRKAAAAGRRAQP